MHCWHVCALLGKAAVIIYAAYACLMIVIHPAFIYPFGQDPFREPAFSAVTPVGTNVALQVLQRDQDGVAVLYFMGNGGALTYFRQSMYAHVAKDRALVALEYPGGGGIAGVASEALLKEQALLAYDWLAEHHTGKIIVHGYSLGTGLAVFVAASRPVDGIILDAPFARLCDLMTRAALLPACYLPMVQRWDTRALVDQVNAPVLIQHGTADDMIPINHGESLANSFRNAGADVTFVPHPGATHQSVINEPKYIDSFIAKISGSASSHE